MRHFLLAIAAFMLLLPADTKTARENYIAKYSSIAISEMERSGVPASITLAQGLLESSAGQSRLAVEGNNHFGIKCGGNWKNKKMYEDDDAAHECFRVYPTVEASFRDHSDFLRYQNRYKSLFDLEPGDYEGWAKGLKAAGYATDPGYANKLINLIKEYELYRFDKGVEVPEETPLEIEKPVLLPSAPTKTQKYNEKVNISLSRAVYEQNGVPFVYSIEGETYASIAGAYGLFDKEILKYNDLKSSEPLEPGTVVYIQAKKKYAGEGMEMLIIGPDDNMSLRHISQRYAVRMSSIMKINALPAGYQPKEGDTIKLVK